jgi:hypothetical protein
MSSTDGMIHTMTLLHIQQYLLLLGFKREDNLVAVGHLEVELVGGRAIEALGQVDDQGLRSEDQLAAHLQ